MAKPFGMDPVADQALEWTLSIDGEEIERLGLKYRDRVGGDEWEGVRETAVRALASCPDPGGAAACATGLALGKVQSGKTLSYTALVALAADNGYRVVVVLAGTKNALLEQTNARLCRDLETSRRKFTPFRNPPPQDAEVVRGVLAGGGHALIVSLKHPRRINDVTSLLSSPELRGCPTLIIDDEGDEASLNTQFRRGSQSAIYSSIVRLRDTLPLHAYVAYTATPQANLLIPALDVLSPDFCVLVEPGEGYCGESVFFGENSERYVRLLPADEGTHEYEGGVPDGLKLAIATFLVGSVIRHRRDEGAWYSMLVHNSNLTAHHRTLSNAVRGLLETWRDSLSLPDNDPAAADVLRLARKAYEDLRTTVDSPPTWDEVKQQLRQEVWQVEVWMVNSLPQGRDPIETAFRLRNNILIGGNMLGRGLTIEDLAVTYITRRARTETNADTMEQRTRWFGYKRPYLDLCRLFMTRQLRDDYKELLRHEDDFWEALRRNQRQGILVGEWPRMFALDTNLGLRPTRASVANYRAFRARGWEIQYHLVEDESVAQQNIDAVERFFRDHPGDVRRYGNVEHLVVPDCKSDEVISGLLSQIQTEGTDWENSYIVEYLARLLLHNRLPAMEVLLMAKGTFRNRKRDAGGRVNPMQGRSPGIDRTDPRFYRGDENIHRDRVQLQVHLIRLRATATEKAVDTTALALYIPRDDPRYDLRFVVRDQRQ